MLLEKLKLYLPILLMKNSTNAMLEVDLQYCDHGKGLPLPQYQTDGSSGVDLHAAISEPILIQKMQRVLVPTGIKLSIPEGYEGASEITLRSCIEARDKCIKFSWDN